MEACNNKELFFDEKVLFEQIIAKFGIDAQLGMVTEECGELIVAINKLKRSPQEEKKAEDVINEIVDVTIMLEQLLIMMIYFLGEEKTEKIFKDILKQKLKHIKNLISE